MNDRKPLRLSLAAAFLLSGCGTYERHGLEPALAAQIENASVRRQFNLSPEKEDRILALDPAHVTEKDIQETLAQAPAPRLINIHGGISPVQRSMISFARFLIAMGYPEASIRNPGDGTYTFSCYESSDQIAGFIAWYYEREGLRPVIVGHSQGGMQTIKVLDKLASHTFPRPSVWNPLTWKNEHRYEITDPLTGRPRPIVGLALPYATSVGAGGLTRFLPNQWDMCGRLRTIPDSVEEFTGFYKEKDLLGGDFLGYGPANFFKPNGTAHVRNIELPADYEHGKIPDTEHLAKNQQVRDRINSYAPENRQELEMDPNIMDPELLHILWAADVWYSLKKHWVLELQRGIRAQRASGHVD